MCGWSGRRDQVGGWGQRRVGRDGVQAAGGGSWRCRAETRARREREKGGGTAPTFIGLPARGGVPPRSEASSPESGAPIGPNPSRGLLTLAGNRTTSFPTRSSRQRNYSAPTPRHDTNRPHQNWSANCPVKPPGPCPGDRSRVPHARSSVRPAPINAPALSTPTWPALYNIPLLDRSFAGRRDDKTFTIHGESAAASEGRRYIVMDKSMHVSRSTRGSAMSHVVSVRVRPILLACARGEHRYASDIEEI